jgi:hypothetical protein
MGLGRSTGSPGHGIEITGANGRTANHLPFESKSATLPPRKVELQVRHDRLPTKKAAAQTTTVAAVARMTNGLR